MNGLFIGLVFLSVCCRIGSGVRCYFCDSSYTRYGRDCWRGSRLDKIARKIHCRYKCMTIYTQLARGGRYILRGCGSQTSDVDCVRVTTYRGDVLKFCGCVGDFCNDR
ncbi:uncharacterized protein LOC141913162 isoform X2 [Tubulanus polymorphus]|uniref:uncharacterized protein LOC141913162 isoform X2 n=1 Tax=Tubulanus polymorphus TaxID=672921 RepID=UPI003DA1FF79